MTTAELQTEVGTRFARLGLPSWPDPHPDRSPREDEYSRVTDPARYGVVHARGRVWAQVLADLTAARVEELPAAVPDAAGRVGYDRAVRVVPPRVEGLPLLLLERDVRDAAYEAPLAVLEIAVARPEVVVERWPDCGCDACDTGSADLLDAVDRTIVAVVGGPFVVLQAHRWQASWHPDGGSCGGEPPVPDFHEMMGICRRLADGRPVEVPLGAEAFVGQSWLG